MQLCASCTNLRHSSVKTKSYTLKVRPHYAAWQNATQYSVTTRQKLFGICRQFDRVHIKREFFVDNISGYKNCGMRLVNFVWFFSLIGWCHFETLYLSYAARQTLDETGILPIKFSCCGMQKPCLSCATLTSTLFPPFAAQQGCILLHSVARHSVDAPLYHISVAVGEYEKNCIIAKFWYFLADSNFECRKIIQKKYRQNLNALAKFL